MSEKITRAAYARHRGCSKAYITKLVTRGVITLDADNRLNAAEADAQVLANSDPNYLAPAPSEEVIQPEGTEDADAKPEIEKKGVTFNSARTMREVYAARLARLDFELRTGQVIALEEVTKREYLAARNARDILLNVPDRLAPAVMGMKDVDKVHALMTKEINNALEELVTSFE